MSKRTALYPAHVGLRAHMTEFCGWQMPLHYGSQIEEHLAVRRACGMFDISHMGAVDIAGTDAAALLAHLLANDAGRLNQPGKALYSCMLNEAGGVLDDLIAYRLADGCYRLVVNACTTASDLTWIRDHLARWQLEARVTLRDDLAMLAVQGPLARETVWRALPQLPAATAELAPFCASEVDGMLVARTGYTGEDGFELALPAERAAAVWSALQQAGARPCGLGARDTLRLEAGLNLYGQDMDTDTLPFDAGLGWTVHLDDAREFVGKPALLVRAQLWRQLGLLLEHGGVLRAQQKVLTAHGEGIVTSGSYSPTLQASIALARLPLAVGPGDAVSVEIRGKPHAVRVVKPPFVRHGKVRV